MQIQRKQIAWVTLILALCNIIVWTLFIRSNEQHAAWAAGTFGFSPLRLSAQLSGGNVFGVAIETARSLTSLFVHELDLAHVGINMALLIAFGYTVEQRLGSKRFAAVYLLSGALTCFAYFAICPDGQISYGASSAVCGILGAFLILFGVQKPFRSIFVLAILLLNVLGATNPAAVAQTGFTFWAHLIGLAIGAVSAALLTLEVSPRGGSRST